MRRKKIAKIETSTTLGSYTPTQGKVLHMHLSSSMIAWLVSSILFIYPGIIFTFDLPQLFEPILINELNISTVEIQLLYTVATAPSIITTLITGRLVSAFGLGTFGILAAFVSFIGSIVCHCGVSLHSYRLLFAGRLIYGIFSGVLNVVQMTAAEKWFSGKYLSIVLSSNKLFMLASMSIAAYFVPNLYLNYRNIQVATFAYSIACFTTVAGAISFYVADQLAEGEQQEGESVFDDGEETQIKETEEEEEDDYLNYKATFRDLLYCQPLLKIVILVNGFFPALYFCFNGICTDMLIRKFSMDYDDAKNTAAVLPVVGIFSIPIFSLTITRIGKKSIFILLSSVIGFIGFTLLYLLPNNPGQTVYFPLILIGIFFGLIHSCAWTCTALASPKQLVPLSVGATVCIMSTGCATGPIIFGEITKMRDVDAYSRAILCLVGLSFVCVLLGILTLVVDLMGERVLHIPENDKRVRMIRDRWSRDLYHNKDGIEEVEEEAGTLKSEIKSGFAGSKM